MSARGMARRFALLLFGVTLAWGQDGGFLAPWIGSWNIQFQSTNGGRSYRKEDGSAYCTIAPDGVTLVKWEKAKRIRRVEPLSQTTGVWIHFVSNRYAWRLSPDRGSSLALLVVSEEPDGPETYRALLSRGGQSATPPANATSPGDLSGLYLPKIPRGVLAIELQGGQIQLRFVDRGVTNETPRRDYAVKDGLLTLAGEPEASLRIRIPGPGLLEVLLPELVAGFYERQAPKP